MPTLPSWFARRSALCLVIAAATVVSWSCGGGGGDAPTDPGGGPPAATVGIRVVAGGGVVDTVLAQPLQALVVEVRRPGGALAPGAVVRFESTTSTDSARRFERGVYVCTLSAPSCGPSQFGGVAGPAFAADTADSTGRAKVTVRFGTVAGPTFVQVTVPEFGLRDSVPFTVGAGAAARVRIAVRDTAVYVGQGYTLRAAATDRFGNARSDPIAYTATSSGVATVAADGRLTATAVGRAQLVARAGASVDTAMVSVVPEGRIVAYENSFPSGLVLVNLDGTARRRLTNTSGANGAHPVWSSRTGEVLFQEGESTPRLVLIDSLGNNRRTFLASETGVQTSQFGRFSADGATVTFLGYPAQSGYGIYRANADGTAPTLVRAGASGGYFEAPSMLSPDGTRMLVGSYRSLSVVTVATGAVTPLNVKSSQARWSPDNAWISYTGEFEGPLLGVVRADGTGTRALAAGETFSGPADWSRDGAWLLVRGRAALSLVRVSDGLVLPLPFARALYQGSWR